MHQRYRGRIVRWVDGDTVEIDGWVDSTQSAVVFGSTFKVDFRIERRDIYRLTIVDTPERGDPGYHEAWDFVILTLPPGTEVEFLTHGVDNGGFGRTLADVLIPGQGTTTISSLLLQEGLAKVWTKK